MHVSPKLATTCNYNELPGLIAKHQTNSKYVLYEEESPELIYKTRRSTQAGPRAHRYCRSWFKLLLFHTCLFRKGPVLWSGSHVRAIPSPCTCPTAPRRPRCPGRWRCSCGELLRGVAATKGFRALHVELHCNASVRRTV